MLPTKTISTTFARVMGVNEIKVSAAARSEIRKNGASACGLCVLGRGVDHDIQNGDVTVNGAGVHFNGDVSVGPNGLVATGGSITVEGSADGPLANYVPDPTTGQPAITDPLADWPAGPDMTGLNPKSVTPCLGGPGIYDDYTLNGGTCNLSPGIYVVTGLWKMGGSGGTIAGNGVVLYFTSGSPSSPTLCATGQAGGTVDMGGSGVLDLTAPTSGPYAGMALWFDRNNNAQAKLHGNGLGGFVGSIYGTSMDMWFTGNACGNTLDALVIVEDLRFSGTNACMVLDYSKDQNALVPPNGLHLDQ